jgi:16S rRNA (adenine1518-N6/adenine1519-N6)-dimethyltransferase
MDKVRAKKYLGQHFLKDKNIAAAIVKALDAKGCNSVIEVGPGMGVLTGFLVERNFPILKVIEIDTESVDYLRANFDGRLEIISADFLSIDLESLASGPMAIIGNFPYNISSQIFFKVIENREKVTEVTCMIQREVAQRICSDPGSRVYGILSVLLQAWYDIEYLFTVNENVFSPPPKVKSAVIRLRRNPAISLCCDEKLFIQVVKCCFNQRRKMIRNPIKAMIRQSVDEPGLLSKRPEQLSVSQFVELTNWVASNR